MLKAAKRWVRLKRAGVKRPQMVLSEARRARLRPQYALAMLENETGVPQRNIFGCDYGARSSAPWCHQKVTRARVLSLLAQNLNNGVGWTQLTYRPFVDEAERHGGAHKPRYQMRVGFRVLKDNIDREGSVWSGFRAYNGTGSAAEAYANRALSNAAKWERVLQG